MQEGFRFMSLGLLLCAAGSLVLIYLSRYFELLMKSAAMKLVKIKVEEAREGFNAEAKEENSLEDDGSTVSVEHFHNVQKELFSSQKDLEKFKKIISQNVAEMERLEQSKEELLKQKQSYEGDLQALVSEHNEEVKKRENLLYEYQQTLEEQRQVIAKSKYLK